MERINNDNISPGMCIQSAALATLLLAASCYAQAAAPDPEAAIRAVIARYLDARNHVDESETRAVLTFDADQLVSTGEWRRGRDNLVRGAMASSRKESAGGPSRIELDSVRLITADVAVADGDYQTNAASAARKMRTTFVVKRENGEWKISAIRNMLPAPTAR